jgi:RNA polymerase sigma-70 factor, ECF subfamily
LSERPLVEDEVRQLYEMYSHDIYRYARMTLGHSADAYDVVQEVFLRAFRSWNTYRQKSTAKTWLMSIARNYMIDLLRKRQRESTYMSSYILEETNVESTAMEVTMEIEVALSQLKSEYRQVIILRHVENLSMEETGQVLGWSVPKVRTTTHRAMVKLRSLLHANDVGGGNAK